MKIRDERLRDLKCETGINENIRPAASGLNAPILPIDRLNDARAGRANRDDAAALRQGFRNALRRVRSDFIPFRMNLVIFDALDFDRLKRADADMQRDGNDVNPLLANRVKEGFGEMQSGGRRGDCAFLRGVHGLIARPVGV